MTTAVSTPSPGPVSGDAVTPRVAFFSGEWCVGPHINLGGSDYWRLALPASKLYENGWDIVFARNLAEGPDGRLQVQDPSGEWRDDRDIIVIQRWMGEKTAERLEKARAAGQVIINEVDDDYWDFPDSHTAVQTTDPKVNPKFNREHYRDSVNASSLITVSTPALAETLGDWGPPVVLARNYIDCAFWTPRPPGDFVGWVGGLPWRGRDLEILRDTVIPWLRDRGRFFYHGGTVRRYPTEERLGYDYVTSRPLCPLLEYPKLWEPLRVAVIPIEDTQFGRSKSWIKGLEACARGIPFICSPHAEYQELGAGLIAHEPGDWVRHLDALEDPDFYAEQVAANLQRAQELDIDHHWHEWATIFREAMTLAR